MKLKKVNLFIIFFILTICFNANTVNAKNIFFAPKMSVQLKNNTKNVALITLNDENGIDTVKLYEMKNNKSKEQSIKLKKIDDKTSSFKISKLTSSKKYLKIMVSDKRGNKHTEYFSINLNNKEILVDRGPRIYAVNGKLNSLGTAFIGNTEINVEDLGGLSLLEINDTGKKKTISLNQSEIKYKDKNEKIGQYTIEVGDNEKRVYIIKAVDIGKDKPTTTERIILYGKNYSEYTLLKGTTKQIDIENISNIKSSNQDVVTIDETGKITAKQYGICNITYTNFDGENKTIKIYVKIGNKKLDLTQLKTKNTAKLYRNSVELNPTKLITGTYGTIMQSFDILSGKVYYSTEDKKNIYINKENSDNMMTLKYFGHGQGITVDSSENVWTNSIATYCGDYGYTGNVGISKIKYENKKTYNQYGGVTYIYTKPIFKKDYDGDYSKLSAIANMYKGMETMIDETNGLFGIYVSNQVIIYDLNTINNIDNLTKHKATISDINIAEDKDKKITLDVYDLAEITPLVKIPILTEYSKKIHTNLNNGLPKQGVDIDGDYIYVYQGNNVGKNNIAYVSCFNFKYGSENGYRISCSPIKISAIKDGKLLNQMSNLNNKYAEAEGIKVKNGKIYLGIYSEKKDDDKRYRTCNILTYKTQN